MKRLTSARCNGIKNGYWSTAKKDELIQRLGRYEDTGFEPEEIKLAQWVSVNSRLPEENNGKVLVLGADKKFYFACRNWMYLSDKGEIRIPANYGSGVTITHWMPLPKQPTEKEEV